MGKWTYSSTHSLRQGCVGWSGQVYVQGILVVVVVVVVGEKSRYLRGKGLDGPQTRPGGFGEGTVCNCGTTQNPVCKVMV